MTHNVLLTHSHGMWQAWCKPCGPWIGPLRTNKHMAQLDAQFHTDT